MVRKNKNRKVLIIILILGIFCALLVRFTGVGRCCFLGLVRGKAVRAFKVPASSMHPTLKKGDRILVEASEKYVPQRGDVIVFEYPKYRNRSFLKRVVAFGGESVEIKAGYIYISGDRLVDPPFHKFSHVSLGEFAVAGNPFTVPDGSLFVLGDNSENSRDSRYLGAVPQDDVIGKAYRIYWPPSRMGPVE